MEACEMPNEASDMCLCTEPNTMSDEAISAENGEEQAATSGSMRAKPITTEQKDKLLELFQQKYDGWKNTSLPRAGVDQDLDQLLKNLGLSRSQAGRQLLKFKKASNPELMCIHLDSDANTIQKNITNRLGGVEIVVDGVLESFAYSSFCVDDDFRKNYFDECRDAVRPHVTAFIEAFVEAAAESSARSVTAADQMVAKFVQKRFDILDVRREEFLKDTDLCAKVCKMAQGKVWSPLLDEEPALFFSFLEKQSFDTFNDSLADHGRPELIPPDDLPPADPKDRRAGLLYYLAGWLCFKVKRTLRNRENRDDATTVFWRHWFEYNSIGADDAEDRELPTALTEDRVRARMRKFGDREQLIAYASPALFQFVWGVEVTYSKLLTTANLLAYAGDLVIRIHAALVAHEPTMRLFSATLPDGALDVGDSPAQAKELAGHLLTCYHKMRGRDFVKQMLSNLKSASAEQNRNSHRDRLAAISTAAKAAAKARSEDRNKRSRDETSDEVPDISYFDIEEDQVMEEEGRESVDLLPPL